jgi:inner membrane protein
MDTLTHIVLGGCIGEAIAGKQLGKKALLLGALAQNIPDIDFIASFWLLVSSDVLAHRGFTHSILFALLTSPILAWASGKVFRKSNVSFREWAFFWGLQIFVHIFIDAFNAYGTGWFEPFSHYRVSFNTMFVVDPLFTIWPAIATIALLVLKTTSAKRMLWVRAGLALCTLYLVAGIGLKLFIDHAVEKDLRSKGIADYGYFTTPTPLNNLLWYVVVKNDSGYNTGYRSVFDHSETDLHYVSRNDALLKPDAGKNDLEKMLRFSRGYYTADMWHDTLVFNDLYFGEMMGGKWEKPRYVFHYFLSGTDDNNLIVQRGRFAGWDKATLLAFFKRIKGI